MIIRNFGLAILLLISSNITLANSWSNEAINREIQNPANSADNRDSLRSQASICAKDKNLRFVLSAKDHLRAGGPTFKYWYELILAKRPTNQTVIFIPGGPGNGAIGGSSIPDDFNAILIAPRGTECNFGTFPGDEMTSLQTAYDILDVIKQEKLTNYIIHGHSYGTVLATILGALVAKENVREPKGIILEGVVGPSFFNSWSEYGVALANILNQEMSPGVRSALNAISPQDGEAGRFIGYLLMNSYQEDSLENFHKLETKLLTAKTPEDLFTSFAADYENWKSYLSTPITTDNTDYVLNTLTCEEQYKKYELGKFGYSFFGGRVQIVAIRNLPDICQGRNLQFSGFDPKDYQIHAPIYYFEGDRDFETPPWGAVDHYNSQANSPRKVFAMIHGHGHDLLSFDSPLYPCLSNIYSNVFKGAHSFDGIFNQDGVCR